MRLLAALLLFTPVCLHAQSWCDQIKAVTAEPAVAAAHWGFSVTTLAGSPLCELNAAQLFRPASAAKVFTSAAAVALLGSEHRFTTTVLAEGALTGPTLTGDLVLRGGGDPAFGSPRPGAPETATMADLEDLAQQVAATGLRHITGAVVGDDVYFDRPLYPPNWAADDLLYGFGAPVSALTVHNNQVLIQSAPGPAPGGKASLSTTPAYPYYRLENEVYQQDFGQGCDAGFLFERAPGSRTLRVTGNVAHTARMPCTQLIAIDDPALYAAQTFADALARHGITMQGKPRIRSTNAEILGGVLTHQSSDDVFLRSLFKRPQPSPVQCQVQRVINPGDPPEPVRTTLATHTSAPLLEDLTATVKSSQNLHAELYLRELGAWYSCDHTLRDALHVVREYLLTAGLLPADFVLYDGSGLSDHDLVTPRGFTHFLSYAAAQPWFAQWKQTLPVGGVDGTLATRFTGALKGKVQAKTGTLGESRALTGYVTAASGSTLLFSILVDNHLPASTTDRAATDRIVEAIAAAN